MFGRRDGEKAAAWFQRVAALAAAHMALAEQAALEARGVLLDVARLRDESAALHHRLGNLTAAADDGERATITLELVEDTNALDLRVAAALAKADVISDADREQMGRARGLFFWAGLNVAMAVTEVVVTVAHPDVLIEVMEAGLFPNDDDPVRAALQDLERHAAAFDEAKAGNDSIVRSAWVDRGLDPPDMSGIRATDRQPPL